jgi:L-rhamnose mutarotase
MQNRLGRNVQRKQSINIQSEDTIHGIQTELNFMAPAAKIARLSQGWFVGVTADEVGQEIEYKAFHAKILVDAADLKREQKHQELPNFSIFADKGANMAKVVQDNYRQVKADIKALIDSENNRLANELGIPPNPKKPKN